MLHKNDHHFFCGRERKRDRRELLCTILPAFGLPIFQKPIPGSREESFYSGLKQAHLNFIGNH
jgi:hypothetical protein